MLCGNYFILLAVNVLLAFHNIHFLHWNVASILALCSGYEVLERGAGSPWLWLCMVWLSVCLSSAKLHTTGVTGCCACSSLAIGMRRNIFFILTSTQPFLGLLSLFFRKSCQWHFCWLSGKILYSMKYLTFPTASVLQTCCTLFSLGMEKHLILKTLRQLFQLVLIKPPRPAYFC